MEIWFKTILPAEALFLSWWFILFNNILGKLSRFACIKFHCLSLDVIWRILNVWYFKHKHVYSLCIFFPSACLSYLCMWIFYIDMYILHPVSYIFVYIYVFRLHQHAFPCSIILKIFIQDLSEDVIKIFQRSAN